MPRTTRRGPAGRRRKPRCAAARLAEKRPRQSPHRKSCSAKPCRTGGPASSYRPPHRQGPQTAYFKMINDQGPRQSTGRMLRMPLAGRRLPTAQDRRADPPPDRGSQGFAFLFNSLGTPTNNRDPQIRQQQRRCGSFSSPPAPPNSAIASTFPWTLGWAADLPSSRDESTPKYILPHRGPTPGSAYSTRGDDSGATYFKGIKGRPWVTPARKIDRRHPPPIRGSPTLEPSDLANLTLREKGADVLFMTGIPKFNAHGNPENLR